MSRTAWAAISLLLVAIAWGAAFVLMKDAIKLQPIYDFLALRFTLATAVMVLIRPSVLKKIDRELLLRGVPLGIMLGLGYITQTIGLELTTAAITGFITGLYVVATPLIAALILKAKITRFTWGCVALATAGLALLSLRGWSLGFGEFLVFLCAIAFAAHIVTLGQWSNGLDVYALTIVQLATCTLMTGTFSFVQGYDLPVNLSGWLVVFYTAIFSTALAFVVQTWSQAHMSATKVAVILTMEVVFAAIFALAFGGESLTIKALFGGLMVLTAMFMIVLKES